MTKATSEEREAASGPSHPPWLRPHSDLLRIDVLARLQILDGRKSIAAKLHERDIPKAPSGLSHAPFVVRQCGNALFRKPTRREKIPLLRSRAMEKYNGRMPLRSSRKEKRPRESYISVGKMDRFLAAIPLLESDPRRIGAGCDVENDSEGHQSDGQRFISEGNH
jgi:hypothetical protein